MLVCFDQDYHHIFQKASLVACAKKLPNKVFTATIIKNECANDILPASDTFDVHRSNRYSTIRAINNALNCKYVALESSPYSSQKIHIICGRGTGLLHDLVKQYLSVLMGMRLISAYKKCRTDSFMVLIQ